MKHSMTTCAIALAMMFSTTTAFAQQPPPYGKGLNLEMARKCIAAAEAEAKKNGWLMAFSVVDDTGHLMAMARMDNTQLASIRISFEKARADNNFRRPTKTFQDRAATDTAVLGLPGVITSEGGVPLVMDGKIVGAIGASGGTSQQDGVAAQACVAGFGK